MSSEQEIFNRCLEANPDERDALLNELCGGDNALYARVMKLLSAHEEATRHNSVFVPPPVDIPDPERIDKYRILERIGEGGMGVVYIAEQTEPVRRRVAVKVIKPGMDTREVIARFEAERQALALMTHQNIARIIDGGSTEDGRPFFVMEYVRGMNINEYCRNRILELDDRLALVQQLCEAIQHAHQKGVIHRDLKPNNVLVAEEDGRAIPKVIDFGIAKAVSQPLTDRSLHTRIGHIIGTPDYMSPEQLDSSGLDVDTRTDIYSIGVMLYELLAGTPPMNFRADTPLASEMQRRLRDEDPPLASRRVLETEDNIAPERGYVDNASLARALQGDLDWIVGKAIARDRARRYATPVELAADIQRYLDNEPVLASPPSQAYRLKKFIKRHTLPVSLLATSFVLLLVFSILMSWQFRETAIERDRANREAEVAQRVTEFTASLFELANPSVAGAPETTARELLDAGTRRILDPGSGEQAEMRAALLEAAGNAYRGLGVHAESRRLLESSLRLLEHEGAADNSPVYARGLMSLAHVDMSEGDYAAAVERFQSALAYLIDMRPRDAHLEFTVLMSLAESYRMNAQLHDAELMLNHPTVQHFMVEGSESDRAQVLLSLGRWQAASSELEAAEQTLREAATLYQRAEGQLSEGAASAKTQLAHVLATLGRSDEAKPLLYELVDMRRQVYGDRHAEVGVALNNLGNALSDFLDSQEEAETAYREGLDIVLEQLGPEHPEAGILYNNLGTLFLFQQRWQDAGDAYRESARIREASLGADHPDTASAWMGEALAINKLDEFERAESLLLKVVDSMLANLGSDHWRTGNAMLYLGMVQGNLGNFEEGARNLGKARDVLGTHLGPDHWRTINAEVALAKLQEQAGDLQTSRNTLLSAIDHFVASVGEEHLRTQRAREQLAELERLMAERQ